jgi:hypothetical protein
MRRRTVQQLRSDGGSGGMRRRHACLRCTVLRYGMASCIGPGVDVDVVADGAVEDQSGGGGDSAETADYTSGRTGIASKRSNIARDRRLAKPAFPRIIDGPPPPPAPTSKGNTKTAVISKRRATVDYLGYRRVSVERVPWALKFTRSASQHPKLTSGGVAYSSASTSARKVW